MIEFKSSVYGERNGEKCENERVKDVITIQVNNKIHRKIESKSILTAIKAQQRLIYGLSLSPMRAHFQKIPMNLCRRKREKLLAIRNEKPTITPTPTKTTQ